MDFKLGLDQSLKLNLSLEMKISIEILKMSLKELKEYLEKESVKNSNIEIIFPKSNFSKNEDYENFIENIGEENESLISYLEEQIIYLEIKREVRDILEYLINNLDERGYLISNLEELRKNGGFKLNIFKDAIKILHTLEPIGVGATNLIDCLKIQLENKGILTDTLSNILDKKLEDIANADLKKISLERDIPLAKVKEYINTIKNLNPKPVRGFYVNKKTDYIIPDLFVETNNEELIVNLNESGIPKIRLKNENKKDQILALALERGLIKRQETLLEVGRYVLNYQKEYILFDKNLKTLKVKDIAYSLNLHESTISRALKDKFIKINGKIESLKKYIVLDDKAELIKREILKIIETEDKNNPLSDEKILIKLMEKNLLVQRRTVGKYREELGILSSRKRKK
ncbi:RNA polymerase factor sigma-54 [Cetobacterium somerae]|uniref:RNA polymerase factor sigma-54 n=1 Tax=Cetobacterium somerae TaxID=188913 RepID=UPI00211DF1D0|nr:RNA polymerase factor sigma-54 [Cetobacterium somerae]MCQ9627387.1 RNA polymerase factor sigma-54 [Cetobacterium somerae]